MRRAERRFCVDASVPTDFAHAPALDGHDEDHREHEKYYAASAR